MNSPLAMPTPAAMMPGPITCRKLAGGSGMSRTAGAARCLVGNRSTTDAGRSPGLRMVAMPGSSCHENQSFQALYTPVRHPSRPQMDHPVPLDTDDDPDAHTV